MGFTRYWQRPRELDAATFAKFADACKDVCSSQEQALVGNIFEEDIVRFEGSPGCEPFVVERVSTRRIEREGLVSEYCKTERLPYDEVVAKCILLLRDHFPAVKIPKPS